jgi:hypothetical protein
MVDGLHVPMWNGPGKPLEITLSGVERGLRGTDDRGDVNNVHYICLIGIVTLNPPRKMNIF